MRRVVIVGAGIWGASTAFFLQRSGCEVTLYDRWGPGNAWSGSGGISRIIRLGYGADKLYIDLTARSFHLWEQLFSQTGQRRYDETGLLWLFSEDNADYALDSKKHMEDHGYSMVEESLEQASIHYPQINFTGVSRVFFEQKAGILHARACCQDMVRSFIEIGGTFCIGSAEIAGDKDPSHELLIDGQRVAADAYIYACGPWNRKLFPELLSPYTYTSKQDVYFFSVPPSKVRQFTFRQMPVWFDYDSTTPFFYGMPMHLQHGFKVAYDDRSEAFDPDLDDRLLNMNRLKETREYLSKRFPQLSGQPLISNMVCQYENSLDGHFIMTRHPQHENVIILGGSSGHGFKMGPAIGELVANTMIKDLMFPEMFSLDRFRKDLVRSSQFR